MVSRSSLKVTVKGKQYEGEYEIDGTLLRVFFEGKCKAGHIRGSDPAVRSSLEFGVFSLQLVGGFEASDTKPLLTFWIPL